MVRWEPQKGLLFSQKIGQSGMWVRDTLDEDKADMPVLEDLREDLEEDLGVVEDFMGDYNRPTNAQLGDNCAGRGKMSWIWITW